MAHPRFLVHKRIIPKGLRSDGQHPPRLWGKLTAVRQSGHSAFHSFFHSTAGILPQQFLLSARAKK
jgi:hypothetical protein